MTVMKELERESGVVVALEHEGIKSPGEMELKESSVIKRDWKMQERPKPNAVPYSSE